MSNHLAACKITTAELTRLRAENAALREAVLLLLDRIDTMDGDNFDPDISKARIALLEHAEAAKRGEGA